MFSKRVFITIIFSLIVAVVIALITDNKMDGEKYKALFIHKVHTEEKYDLIIAGDSRIYRGISSETVGDKLNLSAINLGFSSGGHSKLLFELIDRLIDQNSEKKKIILGITPASLTEKAAENGHILRILNKKKEEILEYKYLFPVKSYFAPSSPYQIRKDLKEKYYNKYHQEFNIKDGWVASWYDVPFPYLALESYKDNFINMKVCDDITEELYSKIVQWKSQGIEVYGFFIPSSKNMAELEKVVGEFNPDNFLKGFLNAGGLWINIEENYTSYDGSHLDKESALRLSNEIAVKILSNTVIKTYHAGLTVNDIYDINDYVLIKEIYFKSDSLNTISFFKPNNSGKDTSSVIQVLFKEDLKELKKRELNEIALELSTFYTDTATEALLVCKINNHKVELNTNYSTIPNRWCKLFLNINIPENYKETDSISIYIDNLKNRELYFDSLKISHISKK